MQPSTAQFLTRDPLEAITGQPYTYAGNDPLDNSDPSGLDWCVGDYCLGFHPENAIKPIVNIGRGMSFGLSDKIANGISPGASCTVEQNEFDKLLGEAATTIATGGLAGRAAAGSGAVRLGGITGYTRHGVEQAISRDGHGVSVRAILDAAKNPINVVRDASRATTQYIGHSAVVVLNDAGRVVTTWARNSSGWRY